MSGASAALALFDLDGTLLTGDTDALWCEFLVAEGVLDSVSFRAANRAIVERYARGEIDPAAYCAFYAGTLAGRTPAEWQALRERFVGAVVAPRIAAPAHALVAAHARAGDTLVLTTATNRFLAEPIAALLGIEALIATELELQDKVFTGRNRGVLNMREGKLARLHSWLAERSPVPAALARAVFYSDSINDLPLLSAVGQPVAVDPDERLGAEAAARGWPVLKLAR